MARPRKRPRTLVAALLSLLATAVPGPSLGQDTDASAVAGRPGDLLARGDTAAALALLRERVAEDDEDGRAWLDLGRILSAQATELEADIDARREAKRALERAVELRPSDPFGLLEYGLLLRKQQVGTDAARVLERAWSAAQARGDGLGGADLARLHYQLGKVYETWWNDWRGLIQIPRTTQGNWSCRGVGSGDSLNTNQDGTAAGPGGQFGSFAVRCPPEWWAMLGRVVPLEDLKDEDRQRMLRHFRLALEAEPGHMDAGTSLLGHLADAGLWTEYESASRALLEAVPDRARSNLFHGLGLHRQGRSSEAAEYFAAGVAQLDGEEQAAFGDLSPLLPAASRERYRAMSADNRERSNRTIFSAKDPLYLTPVNERELEHYARVAWAELKFGIQATRTRGWDTEIGQIFIRYGPPVRVLQCCYGGTVAIGSQALARFEYWSYGPEGPNFYFWRNRGRRAYHMGEAAAVHAATLAAVMPERYVPANPTAVHPMPVQVARFRGSRPDLVRLEVYAAPRLDSLDVVAEDTLDAGVFLFDATNSPVWRRVHKVAAGPRGVGLTYRVEVPAARFRFAVEARKAGPDAEPRPATRAEGLVETEVLGPGLALSDLLLADAITSRTPTLTTRADLAISPNRGLTFRAGDPVHIYFEVYELREDGEGVAAYDAELTVTEVSEEGRSILARVFGGARDLLFGGGEGDAAVRWQRTVAPTGGVAPDFLRIELPALDPGSYAIRLSVSDARGGAAAVRDRVFTIVETPEVGG